MTFSEKLGFLLDLTGASNADLARASGVDPSQISRLKSGSRNAPKRGSTIERMADFFAARCQTDYQLHALAETLNDQSVRMRPSERRISELLCQWFRTKDSESSRKLDKFMRDFESYSGHDHAGAAVTQVELDSRSTESKGRLYLGNEGRRAAVNYIIDYMLDYCEPSEILITSDESVEWLIEDKRYSAMINAKMRKLSEKGFTAKRIASAFSDSDSALDSLSRWLSIYMTGGMTTYYYPRLRDGVYKRTMFIAPGVFTLVATSVGFNAECGVTHLTFDRYAVEGYTKEFTDYLEKCEPLTQPFIFERNPAAFSKCLMRFQRDAVEIMSKWLGMPSTTLPGAIVSELERSLSDPAERENVRSFRKIQAQFEDNLAEGLNCMEIIRPYSAEQVFAGEARMTPSLLLPGREMHYTVGEYRLHLMRILSLLDKYPNYRVLIDEGDLPECEMHVKGDHAALLVRKNAPFAVFDVMEQNTIATCREYIMLLATRSSPSIVIQRRRAIEKLRALYDSLER